MAEANPQALRQMWQRVILQAVRDALSVGEIKSGQVRLQRREARDWMEGRTKDFDHVCTLAGFSPDAVREWWAAIKSNPMKFAEAGRLLRDAGARRGEAEDE